MTLDSEERQGLFRSRKTVFTDLARVLQLVWASSSSLTLATALTILMQSPLPAISAYVSKLLIDRTVQAIGDPTLDLSHVLPAIALVLGLGLLSMLLQRGGQLVQELLRDLLSNHVNEMIIERALTLDLSFYEDPQFYDMLRRAQSEASVRPLTLLTRILIIASSSTAVVSFLVLLLRFNVVITLVLVITALPSLFVQARYSREAFHLLSWRAPKLRKLAYFRQLLMSDQLAKEIKLFHLGQLLFDRYRALFAKFYHQNRALAVRRNLSTTLLSLLSTLGYYGCYVYVIRQAIVGVLTLGDLTLYASAFQQLQSSLNGLLTGLSTLYESTLFLNNLFTFLELRPLISPSTDGRRVPDIWQEGLVFHDVSFRYPGTDKDVLHNINLSLHPRERIAFVGKNGAGKTTFVKLLCRLYDPTEGYITLDGVDLREYDMSSLQQRIGVIFQEFGRYYLSARENIGFGDIEMMDDHARVEAAAKKSGAHEIIDALPDGYDSMLGRWFDSGHQLSPGEWQKVALARAFMRDAALLILDEPTASLDASTEYEIFQQFAELTRDRAVVLISHRFSTVRMADRIVVLNDGRIVEDGAHQQLLEQGGIYATLFNMQAEGYR